LNHIHIEVYSIQHYVTKFVSDLRQVGGFLRVLMFPPPINIVESGVKHHNPNPTTVNITYMHIQLYQLSFQNNILTENTDRVIMGPTDRTILES
jgi:hypothetical protein